MPIRVDIQRNAELDAGIEYPSSAWFDSVPKVGEFVHFRYGSANALNSHRVLSVNYMEREPDSFLTLIVVE